MLLLVTNVSVPMKLEIRKYYKRKLEGERHLGRCKQRPSSVARNTLRHFKRGRISQNVREERSPITSAFRSASELPGRMIH